MLKAIVVTKEYRVAIPEEDYSRVFMTHPEEDEIYERLCAVGGVYDVEYNGHFGNNIFFKVNTEDGDFPRVAMVLEIGKIIEEYRDWVAPLDGETRYMVFKADTEVGCHEDVDDPENVEVELFKAGSGVEVDVITEHPEHYFVQFGDGSVANIHKDTVDVMPEDWNGVHPVGQT